MTMTNPKREISDWLSQAFRLRGFASLNSNTVVSLTKHDAELRGTAQKMVQKKEITITLIKNIISKNRVLLFLCHIEPKCKNYVCCRKEWPLACGQYKDKHNAELRKTAPAAKVSCHKCSYTSPPPPKYGQKWQFHTIFLDTFLKIIFKKKIVPGSKCVICSSFTDRKYPKNAKKIT